MPIQFSCPSCQKQFRVADSMAGTKARCTCGQVVTDPGGAAAPAPAPTSARAASFDKLLQEAQDAAAAKRAAEEAVRAERAAAEAAKANPYAAPGAGASPGYTPQRFTPSKVPHRGATVLVMGILGMTVCVFCGFAAWAMGSSDLHQMRAGQMDDSGYALTLTGKILGMITTILFVLSLLGYGVLFVVLFMQAK